jgi:hypothetical protein
LPGVPARDDPVRGRATASLLAHSPVVSYAPRLRLLLTRLTRLRSIPSQLDALHAGVGRLEARVAAIRDSDDIHANEFRTFSQFGEDGIIQWLLRRVPIASRVFVEFGVQNYTESNTRFLLLNDHWRGLVLDGSPAHVAYIHSDPIYGRYPLAAQCAFITRENINALISASGLAGDIGLLSVDIDGNDYWVWEAITVVSPRIVVCEYNGLFGPTRNVSIPYDPAFRRERAHHSLVYFGASLGALTRLATARGYSLVGCTSAGNNAFFVRNDVLGTIPVRTPAEAWAAPGFREARRPDGTFSFLDPAGMRSQIAHLPLHDLDTGALTTVGALG